MPFGKWGKQGEKPSPDLQFSNAFSDLEAPKEIQLDTPNPTANSGVKDNTRFLFGGLILLLLVCAIYGFYKRSHREELRKTQQRQATVASEPAESNRQQVEQSTTPDKQGFHSVNDLYTRDTTGTGTGSAASSPSSQPTVAYRPNTEQPTPVSTGGAPTLSPQEQALMDFEKERLKEEESARQAPISEANVTNKPTIESGPSSTLPGAPEPPQTAAPVDYASLLHSFLPNTGGASGAATEQQNQQTQKEQFASTTTAFSDHILQTQREAPVSDYELMDGTNVPCTLDTRLESDLPGEVTCTVRKNVLDSKTGKYVLIPAGTRFLGEYNSHLTYGQTQVQVAWTRWIYPDMSSREIGKMMAYSSDGTSGLHDKVNNHWGKVIGGLAMTSALAAGLAISQNHSQNGSILQYPSTGEVIGASVGQQANEVGQQIASRSLNLQPTLTIRPGQLILIHLNKDIPFDSPYRPL